MTTVDTLVERNNLFVTQYFVPDLSINPGGNMMVIGCVDPRVDPARILGLEQGEAAVVRNVGGRITPATLRTLGLLTKVGQANPEGKQQGDWNLVILHHTDCGMTDLAAFPADLAAYFEIDVAGLDAKSVSDPVGSVTVDTRVVLATLRANAFLVSGLVYDVVTGRVTTVVPPTPLPAP
jgi:carbonic anhydrase